MILQKKRQDWQGMLASLLILLGIVYAWLCFTCVLRQGHVPEDDYMRMTQEIVQQSVPEGVIPTGWEHAGKGARR